MTTKLAFFIADGFQALDLFGPLDAFMARQRYARRQHYDPEYVKSSG